MISSRNHFFARRRDRNFATGFTLIELLVVVVIVAVLAAALTLSIGSAGGARQLEHEAEKLQALLTHACEQAELGGREIGLSFAKDGYGFSRFEGDLWRPLKLGNEELRRRHWNGIIPSLQRNGTRISVLTDLPDKPQLVCFSSGEITPFELDLGFGELDVYYKLTGQPNGALKLAMVNGHVRP
ncbi:type II secretion system minor pseudopilin GspH [Pseudolysobacter antarcticus]|nr:type II secretion system minor pseudopilin GspH [Pseudolysobacter antarcticus]